MANRMHAAVSAIEYYLPERITSTADLASEFPEWSVDKIDAKTGISERHVSAAGECSSDLAVAASAKLFASGATTPAKIDFVLLCTQSPDYFLPTTACLIQDRLGIPTTAGALDFNLGCSGFVYGLGLATGLIASGQAQNLLLLTAETYTKYLHPSDKSVRTIFGDAAAATLLTGRDSERAYLGPFVYGTDGSGGPNLIVPAGGMRQPYPTETAIDTRGQRNLFMDGAEIFNFTLLAVPQSVEALLVKAGLAAADVDLYVFHQANQYILEHLRKRIKIPQEKFLVSMSHCGNTVSSTIPIALHEAAKSGRIQSGMKIMLVGFGVGYSWGATLLRWQ